MISRLPQKTIRTLAFLLAILAPMNSVSAGGQTSETPRFKMTIENIMRGEELVGSEPSSVLWSADGKKLYFFWKKPGEKKAEFYALTEHEATPRKTSLEEILQSPPSRYDAVSFFRFSGHGSIGAEVNFDNAKKRAVIVKDGDLYLLDIATGKMTRLTATDASESGASFSFDQKKIVYSAGDNLFLLSLEDRSLRQMTSFVKKTPPPELKPDARAKWYEDQQKELFQEFQKKQDKLQMPPAPANQTKRKPFFLDDNESVVHLELSPDEKFVLFMISENLPDVKETIVPFYVTRSGYTETKESRPKAAYYSERYKAGVMDVMTGEVKWVDYGQGERKVFPAGVFWSPDGKECVITARALDNKDTWLLRLDVKTAKATPLERVHDEAWVGELSLTNVFWWPDSRHISCISEKDGFAHLYRISLDGREPVQLTKGRFEVYDARLSKDGRRIYLTSNEEHPGERHFYVMPAEGGKRTRITSLAGQNEAVLSPDESSLAILHSYATQPTEVYLQPNQPGAQAKRITLSTTDEFRSYPWYDPEVLTFKARDGVDVYARLYRPKNWHPQKPAVIFIHGAGYLQNAHRGWSTYFHEYMFHNFLMEQGYLVFDVDYRGSAGYGRDCRTAIYRHMGGKDLDDIVDAAKFLVNTCGVNPERIGAYGGSYGGFLTLMAMFKTPDVFRAGAALRPVTDWAHYHPWYTVDILNLPQDDAEAYKQSSPIYFAEGLRGALLICHGMVDTNVHFQDTVRLAQRLIELGKDNWSVSFYPVEDHSFQNASSWTDEYKRIFKLFETNLK
jgi:dipeptidyl aminopeptidase/acylaminoacyl peptidase